MKINIIDVGAIDTLPVELKNNRDKIDKILSFEPMEDENNEINENSKYTQTCCCWNKKSKRYLNIFKGSHGSSLFMQNYDYIGKNYTSIAETMGEKESMKTWFDRSLYMDRKKVQCNTIDNILLNFDDEFHMLKSDTQGAEFEVLHGAENWLKNECLAVQLELFTIPMYKDIKLYDDVIKYLNSLGFELYKTLSVGGTFASQTEVVLIKNVDNEYMNIIKSIYE